MLMAWLPATHASYWDAVSGKVEDLGTLYTGARLGWAVPAFVPADELSSIEDLKRPSVRERLKGRIQGIDPGSGLMQESARALEAYGLEGYRLMSGSGAAMTASMQRAVRLGRWAVVTAWSPHWMFARWDLRYLQDPKGVLSRGERVHALARSGFGRDYPRRVIDFLGRMYLPLEELEQAMSHAVDHGAEAAVDRYLERHPRRVRYWLTGEP
jgi:glycine betaine/proline transport system substrate-binding protein